MQNYEKMGTEHKKSYRTMYVMQLNVKNEKQKKKKKKPHKKSIVWHLIFNFFSNTN